MKIIIGGDVVPNRNLNKPFIEGKVKELLGNDLYQIWMDSNIRIFNLETSLGNGEGNEKNKMNKNGPNLFAEKETIVGLINLRPSLICLANNHIMDYNVAGLNQTMDIFDENNISYIGANQNIYDAKKPCIITKEDKNIGVYNCAEHEFGIASELIPGANPFDPLFSLDEIQELSGNVDYTIVIYHAGKEYYRYPSPELQKVCRSMIDKGADFVVTQHSHCIGSKEVYKGKTIVYGQGNFLFNDASKLNNHYWNNGLIIQIELNSGQETINYIPYLTTENGIRIASNDQKNKIIGNFLERSEKIKDKRFILSEYSKYSEKLILNYLRNLSGQNKWIKRIDNKIFKGKLTRWYFNKKKLLIIQNFVECEAHRELLLEGIKNLINSKRK